MDASVKERVLKKFVEILSQNGIENTTTRQLYGAAGVGSTMVYEEWGSKENMVIAAGKYITDVISQDVGSELHEYARNYTVLGEYFFNVFKRHREEMRFCIQLMSSPNEKYSVVHKHIGQAFEEWSNELADILDIDRKLFFGSYLLFMSSIYFYCMTGNEAESRWQRFHLYEEFNHLKETEKG